MRVSLKLLQVLLVRTVGLLLILLKQKKFDIGVLKLFGSAPFSTQQMLEQEVCCSSPEVTVLKNSF
ncbi:hypothetical protein ACO0LM_15365 [Undibacterium sp. Di26W]|uniref:hypothetical protein n=1 Tax=Undibacterium sp. Di26W TaxID=3413035 RepID=UPI003BF02FA4